jgi:hypothetical protein
MDCPTRALLILERDARSGHLLRTKSRGLLLHRRPAAAAHNRTSLRSTRPVVCSPIRLRPTTIRRICTTPDPPYLRARCSNNSPYLQHDRAQRNALHLPRPASPPRASSETSRRLLQTLSLTEILLPPRPPHHRPGNQRLHRLICQHHPPARLRHEAELDNGMVRNTTVGFFMPCHSTPWRSHLVHPEINAWALTCEPPIDVPREYRDEYLDEADVFYMHPGGWVDENMADRKTVSGSFKPEVGGSIHSNDNRRHWPEYLIFFEHLEPVMNAILEETRYEECWRGFNTHWHDDGRRRGDVVVRCLRQ